MPTVDELTEELEATRRKLELMTSEVASNEEKMRRTHQRELRLLQAESLDTLGAHEVDRGRYDEARRLLERSSFKPSFRESR